MTDLQASEVARIAKGLTKAQRAAVLTGKGWNCDCVVVFAITPDVYMCYSKDCDGRGSLSALTSFGRMLRKHLGGRL